MTAREFAAGTIFTREELYRMLWAEPAGKVAARLGVTDRYLSQKVCSRLDIPVPPCGYWQKLKAKKPVPPVPPLPERSPGTEQLWRMRDRPAQPLRPRQKQVSRGRLAKPAPGWHPLVREAAVRHVMNGTGNNGEYLKPRRTRLADLSVTCQTLFRSLHFINTLYQTMEGNGCRVMLALDTEELFRIEIESGMDGSYRGTRNLSRWTPVRPTVAYVYGVPIGLALVEQSERVEMKYVGGGRYIDKSEFRAADHFGPTWDALLEKPSGRLKLIAYSPFRMFPWSHRWGETQETSLDRQLPSIVSAIQIAALDLATKLETVDWYFERDT
ncbi:hypothetical protein ACC697_04110 [Rhizobium ruizarguesonis]